MSSRDSALDLAVIWSRLLEITDEMGVVIRRTAYSASIREAEDCAAALFDAEGRLLANAVFTPGMVGSMPLALANVLRRIPPEHLRPGDGVLTNDPYLGNGHLPDMFCFSPIYWKNRRIGYAGVCGHQLDIGGAAPGSQQTVGVTDMYQEGMRVPPVKAFIDGAPVPDVFDLITANVRRAKDTAGDLKSEMNACLIGARRMAELYDDYGKETVDAAIASMFTRSDEAVSSAIADLPEGHYEFEDYLDDSGPDTEPLRVKATVTISHSPVSLSVDFEGSGPQVAAAINCPFNFTYAWALFAVRCLIAPHIPENDGVRRRITIEAPVGSFLHPEPPAPSGARATSAMRITEVVLGALAQAIPDRAVAAPSHFCNATFGGFDKHTNSGYVYYEMLIGGSGARLGHDGMDGMVSHINCCNIPIEVQEANAPVIIDKFEYLRDTGGPGQWRGGTGVRKVMKLTSGPVRLTNLGDRYKFPPWGLYGGMSGALGSSDLVRDGVRTSLGSKVTISAEAGDAIEHRVSGAGGWGDPMAREPTAVLDDVLDGLISSDQALEVYGVAVDLESESVDVAATAQRRGQPPPL